MKLFSETPHFTAMCRDKSMWRLPMDAYSSFRASWMEGKPFWEGVGSVGNPVSVKLADITGLEMITQEELDRIERENEELKHRKLLDGSEV